MSKHIPYPDTVQFRNACKHIKTMAEYCGKNEEGEPVYSDTRRKPTITFNGTVKTHGTNSSICVSSTGEVWYQSRLCIITPTDDNAGFASWAKKREVEDGTWTSIASYLLNGMNDLPEDYTVTIYGEWVGKGVNSGCAIHELPKAFFVFAARYDSGSETRWLDIYEIASDPDNGLYNIYGFDTFSIDVNFNIPDESVPAMLALVEQVENCCPVARAFGVDGIGEGIVWTAMWEGQRLCFKTKGEKHSTSKVKVLSTPQSSAGIQEFVDAAVTQSRFDQCINAVFGDPSQIDVKRLGDVMKWMGNDILKEESDVLEASGLEWKKVAGAVSNRVRSMYFALEARA